MVKMSKFYTTEMKTYISNNYKGKSTREIQEELDTTIKVEKYFDTVEYDYPTFHLSMDCFICSIKDGNLTLKEHEAAKWLSANELDTVDWLPADISLIGKLKEELKKE